MVKKVKETSTVSFNPKPKKSYVAKDIGLLIIGAAFVTLIAYQLIITAAIIY